MVCAQGSSVTSEYAQRVARSTSIHIDGKLEPDRVPLSIRMKLFFYRYDRGEGTGYKVALSKQLSAADQRVLEEYAQRHKQAVQEDEREFSRRADDIVLRAMGLSAMEIAGQFQNLHEARQEKALARYELVLAQLSPQGRAVVERFAFERVRPSITMSMPIDVARVAPSMFMADVNERRAQIVSGDQQEPTNG